MTYTNYGLVKHAKKALALKTKYMWGGILRLITNSYIDMLAGIPGYKVHYPPSRVAELRLCVGKNYYGVDCVGLIKSYYWSGKPDGGVGSPNYGAAGYPDVNANGMFAAAKIKGKIETLPETPGIILYCKTNPHVGVYVGNGYVIESTYSRRGDGVVRTKVSDFKWEYWFECPYISYVKKPIKIKVGDKVKIKDSAKTYSGGKIVIPDYVKGKIYTVSQVSGTKSLLKEIYSWVDNIDLEKV